MLEHDKLFYIKIGTLIELLNKFSVREVIRTGRVATLRGTLTSGMDDGEFQQDNSVLPLPQILEGTGSV